MSQPGGRVVAIGILVVSGYLSYVAWGNSKLSSETMALAKEHACDLDSSCIVLDARARVGKADVVRHRYEYNNDYRERLERGGLKVSGTSPDNNLVEIVEIEDHPWFLGCQFHPEFKSKPMRPHPLFRDFIKASLTYSTKN